MIRWGILGTARMATHRLLPAVHSRETIVAIGSRNMEKARAVAEQFGIPKAYGAYEDLLSDPHVDAVYIPLPNHLHVPWAYLQVSCDTLKVREGIRVPWRIAIRRSHRFNELHLQLFLLSTLPSVV